MNPALLWSKKNWPIIVSSVVILGSVPTAWYFSDAWNKQIQKKEQDAATRALGTTKVSVIYTVRNLKPGKPDFTMTDAPNDVVTKVFVGIKNELFKQAAAVIERVTAFNKGVGVGDGGRER